MTQDGVVFPVDALEVLLKFLVRDPDRRSVADLHTYQVCFEQFVADVLRRVEIFTECVVLVVISFEVQRDYVVARKVKQGCPPGTFL